MGFIRLFKLFIAITIACHVIHEHSSIATTIHDEQLVYQVKDGKTPSSAFGNSFEKVHPLLRETEFAANKKPKKPPAHKPAPAPTVSPTAALTPSDVTDVTDAPDASSSTDDKKKEGPKTGDAKSPTNKPSTKKTPPPTDDADAPESTPTAEDSPSDDAKTPGSDDSDAPVVKRLSPTSKPSPVARLGPTMKPAGAGNHRPTEKPVKDAEPSSDESSDSEGKTPTKKPIVEKPTRRIPTQKPVAAVPVAEPTEDSEPTSTPFQSPTVPEDATTESPGDDIPEGDDSKADDSKKNGKNKNNNKKNKGGSGSGDGDDADVKTKAPAPSRTKAPGPTKKPFGKPPKNPPPATVTDPATPAVPATEPATAPAPADEKDDKGEKGDQTPAAGDIPNEDEPEPTSEPAFSEGGGQANAGSVGGAENVNEEIKNEDRTALNSAKYFSITFVLSLIFCGLLYTFRRYACTYHFMRGNDYFYHDSLCNSSYAFDILIFMYEIFASLYLLTNTTLQYALLYSGLLHTTLYVY